VYREREKETEKERKNRENFLFIFFLNRGKMNSLQKKIMQCPGTRVQAATTSYPVERLSFVRKIRSSRIVLTELESFTHN
jgi:hypothetical protein